jgi:hypothetical protein
VLALSVICPAWADSQSGEPFGTFNVVGMNIADLAQAQSRGRITSLQLVDAYLARIARLDHPVNQLASKRIAIPRKRAPHYVYTREIVRCTPKAAVAM